MKTNKPQHYAAVSAAFASTNRAARYTMILDCLAAPQNTPRSVTMLPLGQPVAPFVPELDPLHDPNPHYHDFAQAAINGRREQTQKQDGKTR